MPRSEITGEELIQKLIEDCNMEPRMARRLANRLDEPVTQEDRMAAIRAVEGLLERGSDDAKEQEVAS